MTKMVELQEQDLLIGGRWRPAANGRTCEKLGSYTGQPVSRVAAASRDDARAAADAAAEAFPSWSSTPPAERRDILLRAADLLASRAEEIAAIVTAETGSTFGWGMFNVHLATSMLREAGAQAYGLLGEVIPSDPPDCWPWDCASPSASSWGSRPGTPRSSSASVRWPCPWPTATPSYSRPRSSRHVRMERSSAHSSTLGCPTACSTW
jgi:Aldehyde dehydrogenase family